MKWAIAVVIVLVTALAAIVVMNNKNKEVNQDLEQSASANEYIAAANKAVTLLSENSISEFMELVSPKTLEEEGREKIEAVAKSDWYMFFKELKTNNQANDVNFVEDDGYGNPYAEIYSSFTTKGGEAKNYAVIVIKENGNYKIGTILPNQEYSN